MFERANIIDHSHVVLDVVTRLNGEQAATEMICKLKNPAFYIFISESGKSVLSYEPVFGSVKWWLVHTFCDESERGVDLKRFLISTGLYMVDRTGAEAFMAVIPPELRRYGIFLAQVLGMKRRCKEMGSTVYTIGADQYDRLEETLDKLTKEIEDK